MAKIPNITRSDFTKIITITTRWSDNDIYQHVNNVMYFSFFDTAVNQNMLEHGVLNVVDSPVVGLVVDNHCQFFASITFPDTVHVGVATQKIGNSSVKYLLGIFKNDEEQLSALGDYTHVYVSRENHRPVTIPDPIRKILESLQFSSEISI